MVTAAAAQEKIRFSNQIFGDSTQHILVQTDFYIWYSELKYNIIIIHSFEVHTVLY